MQKTWTTRRHALFLAAFVALYVASGFLGFLYRGHGRVSTLWPASGIALAAVLLWGPRMAIGVGLGAAINTYIDGASAALIAAISLGHMGAALAGTWLIRRLAIAGPALRRLRDVPAFALACLAAPIISASCGALGLQAYRSLPWSEVPGLWATWWAGNAVGTLVIAPPLLEWAHPVQRQRGTRYWLEMGALSACVGAVAGGAFLRPIAESWPVAYLVFPLVIWAAWRFGPRGATTVSFVIGVVVLWATPRGFGPFGGRDLGEAVALVQVFLGVLAVTAVMLGVTSEEIQRAIGEAVESQRVSRQQLIELEEIFRHSPNGLAFLDTDLRFLRVNERLASLTGLPAAAHTGRTLADVWHPQARQASELLAAMRDVLATGAPAPDRLISRALPSNPAETRWWKVGIYPHLAPGGSLGGLYMECVDVTQLRREQEERLAVEHQLVEAREQESRALRQSDALKSALLSSVSHELRTPLTSLKAAASSLVETRLSDGTRHELVQNLNEDVDYLTRLVNNLLDMSRIEAGRLVPDREWHTIEELIEGAMRRVGAPLELRPLTITVEPDLPPIYVDGIQVQQVLVNLLDNAAKYSPAGSPIAVDVRRVDGQLQVDVGNAGTTLSPAGVARLFDRFYRGQGSEVGTIRGLGLGLAIAKGAIEAHGGRVWVDLAAREGWTVFRFRLPLEAGAGRALASPLRDM